MVDHEVSWVTEYSVASLKCCSRVSKNNAERLLLNHPERILTDHGGICKLWYDVLGNWCHNLQERRDVSDSKSFHPSPIQLLPGPFSTTPKLLSVARSTLLDPIITTFKSLWYVSTRNPHSTEWKTLEKSQFGESLCLYASSWGNLWTG